jgi:hypothetical protein
MVVLHHPGPLASWAERNHVTNAIAEFSNDDQNTFDIFSDIYRGWINGMPRVVFSAIGAITSS